MSGQICRSGCSHQNLDSAQTCLTKASPNPIFSKTATIKLPPLIQSKPLRICGSGIGGIQTALFGFWSCNSYSTISMLRAITHLGMISYQGPAGACDGRAQVTRPIWTCCVNSHTDCTCTALALHIIENEPNWARQKYLKKLNARLHWVVHLKKFNSMKFKMADYRHYLPQLLLYHFRIHAKTTFLYQIRIYAKFKCVGLHALIAMQIFHYMHG